MKRKPGHPTEYDPKTVIPVVTKYAGLGYTNEQIAKKLNIAQSTLYEWQNKHPEMAEALKKAKRVIDDKIEQKLFKRAMGYSYTETTRELCKVLPEGDEKELTITKKVTKKMPPDVTAQIFWLKNRRPAEWRDKIDLAHSGALKVEIDKTIYEAVHGDADGGDTDPPEVDK